jgi:VWFA-related protein
MKFHELAERTFAGCLELVMAGGVTLSGQQKVPPVEAPSTLKVSTEVVNVLAVVKDKKGHLVPDLQRKDFEIWEDNKLQDLRYFSRETDTPLTLGLLVDTSASQGRVLPQEQQEAKAFLRQILRAKDLAFVLHFDLDVELLQDFTDDLPRLNRAIDETEINGGGGGVLPGPFPGQAVGGTHLYDAVYLASNELMKDQI